MEPSTYLAQFIGAAVGGTTLTLLSAAGTYAVEKTKPTSKTLARDFILGSVLFMFIIQILPESSGNLIQGILRFVAPSFAMVSAAATATSSTEPLFKIPSISSVAEALTPEDMEVKVGVPRF